MNDMHEVKGTKPHPFHHVGCRDVAARAGSVYLMYSMDRKLDRKGGGQDTPTTAPSCSSRMPILQEMLTNHWNPTGSQQTMPLIQHGLDTKRHSMTFQHTSNWEDEYNVIIGAGLCTKQIVSSCSMVRTNGLLLMTSDSYEKAYWSHCVATIIRPRMISENSPI